MSVRARHTCSTAVTPQLRPQLDNCPAAGEASGTAHHKHKPVDASNPSSPPALHYPRIHMINSCTGSTPQKPHRCQHCQRQFPSEFPRPKFWFSQLVERSYTDDETGRTHRSIGVVEGLTLNLPGWKLPGWVYFVKFLWSEINTPQLPFIDEVSESDRHPVLFT